MALTRVHSAPVRRLTCLRRLDLQLGEFLPRNPPNTKAAWPHNGSRNHRGNTEERSDGVFPPWCIQFVVWPGLHFTSPSSDEHLGDRVLSEKVSVLVRDAQGDLRTSTATRLRGVCSILAIPLQSDARAIGLVYLDSLDPGRRFDRRDLHVLTALANRRRELFGL